MTPVRTARRLAIVTGTVLAAALAFAAPASAHVEVEAEDARALGKNVTVSFNAESESPKAGITKLEVILPEGISPDDIKYEKGPSGWKLKTTDRGYTVSGPAVATGKDAEYSVTVKQLPDAESVVFKTLQTYSDDHVDRWIELEEPKDAAHGSQAPILKLKPAAPGAEPASPSTEPSKPAADDKPAKAAAEEKSEDGSAPTVPIVIGGIVLVALAGGAWWFKRRSTANSA